MKEKPVTFRCLGYKDLYLFIGPEGDPHLCPKCGFQSDLDFSKVSVVDTWEYGYEGRCAGCDQFRGQPHLEKCDMRICDCGIKFLYCEQCNPTPAPPSDFPIPLDTSEIGNEPEKINHPSHYKGKGMEAIDVIEAFELGFNLGNVVKYVLRSSRKGDRRENLLKALWYLDREIRASEKVF